MGYRIDETSGVATGDMEQTIYMVTRGDHFNAGCCFDYVTTPYPFHTQVFCRHSR